MKRKPTGESDQARKGEATRRAGANTLARLYLFLLGVLVAIALVSGTFGWYAVSVQADKFERQSLKATVASVGGRLSLWVGTNARFIDQATKNPALGDWLATGNESALRTEERRLLSLLPDAISVRLLAVGHSDIDQEQAGFGYASLGLLRKAERAGQPPPAEIHGFGGAEPHVAIARRVMPPGAERPAGVLYAAFSLAVPRQVLESAKDRGVHLQLQQRTGDVEASVLGSEGQEPPSGMPADGFLDVPGTLWRLAFWSGARDRLSQLGMWLLGILVLALTLTGAAVFWHFRLLGSVLKADQKTAVRLFEDSLTGKAEAFYPARLMLFREAFDWMTRRALAEGTPDRPLETGLQPPAEAFPHEPADGLLADNPLYGDIEGVQPETIKKSKPPVEPTAISAEIFRAYDIRGIAGKALSKKVVFDIGRALGTLAYEQGEQTVLVGRDGRTSSEELSEALCSGLRSSGRDVVDLGLVPTPVLYFATHFVSINTGVMVTGSHNPAEYNGLKVTLAGRPLCGDELRGLRDRIIARQFVEGDGGVRTQVFTADYISRVTGDVHIARPMKVVVDCGNGVASLVAPKLLRALGCDVVELFCEVDGRFPNHPPDPGRPENLAALQRAVLDEQADIGIALDGDGDRVGVIDSEGQIIWPDRLLMLFASDVLSRQPGADILYDVKCSRHLAEEIVRQGGRPMMWKTGHAIMKLKMQETGALLGGEMSGHVFFKDRWFGFDDGQYAAARLLEILSMDSRSSAEVFAEIPESVSTPELVIPVAEGENARIVEALTAKARFADAQVIDMDGLRVEFPGGWGLLRASNTMPALVARFEADDEAELKRIQRVFREYLLAVRKDLDLPF